MSGRRNDVRGRLVLRFNDMGNVENMEAVGTAALKFMDALMKPKPKVTPTPASGATTTTPHQE